MKSMMIQWIWGRYMIHTYTKTYRHKQIKIISPDHARYIQYLYNKYRLPLYITLFAIAYNVIVELPIYQAIVYAMS